MIARTCTLYAKIHVLIHIMSLFTTFSPQYMYSYVIRPINSQIQSILKSAVRTLLWFSQDYTQNDLKAIKTSLTPYTQTVVRMLLNFQRTIYDITVRDFCGVFGTLTHWSRVTLYPPAKCAIIASDIGGSQIVIPQWNQCFIFRLFWNRPKFFSVHQDKLVWNWRLVAIFRKYASS